MIKHELQETERGMQYLRIEMSGAVGPGELQGGIPHPKLAGAMPRLLVADDTARVPSETRRMMAALPTASGNAIAAAVTECEILRASLKLLSRALGGTLRIFSTEEEALQWLGSVEQVGPRFAAAA